MCVCVCVCVCARACAESTWYVGHYLAYCTSPRWLMMSVEQVVEWLAEENRSARRTRTLVPLCPSQIPHDVTRAAAVGSQELTVWAMVRPLYIYIYMYSKLQILDRNERSAAVEERQPFWLTSVLIICKNGGVIKFYNLLWYKINSSKSVGCVCIKRWSLHNLPLQTTLMPPLCITSAS
jgi:hypothetical protein